MTIPETITQQFARIIKAQSLSGRSYPKKHVLIEMCGLFSLYYPENLTIPRIDTVLDGGLSFIWEIGERVTEFRVYITREPGVFVGMFLGELYPIPKIYPTQRHLWMDDPDTWLFIARRIRMLEDENTLVTG
jgi:hypothetical protein